MVQKNGRAELEWKLIEERRNWQQAREGAYLLRTNLPADDPEGLHHPAHHEWPRDPASARAACETPSALKIRDAPRRMFMELW
ncbi:MAG: hypothetical protein M1482_15900 [Chloroflexi bacterium]|nr:hypothetical protein [Chloroflexota bacterium]